MRFFLGIFLFTLFNGAFGQSADSHTVKVMGSKKEPLVGATVQLNKNEIYVTNKEGEFSFGLNTDSIRISISFVGFISLDTTLYKYNIPASVALVPDTKWLSQVTVQSSRTTPEVSLTTVGAYSLQNTISASGDIAAIIATMPGVTTRDELSSGYSVRGGNFDENLVYIQDIPVYRPFLSSPGRQEGLSIVNPEMISHLAFSAGGWQAKYGDKISSNLIIEYKEPEELTGQLSVGLLGGSLTVGNGSPTSRFSHITGFRYRDTRYLLNTLQVEGQYFPKYMDIQSLLSWDLTSEKNHTKDKTKLNLFLANSRNNYLTIPTSQTSEFGSVAATYRLQTFFEGRELLDYNTYQAGVRLNHKFTSKAQWVWLANVSTTSETENFEIEGAYRLCDVDNRPGSSTFDNCVVIRGAGTQYKYGRNKLDATLFTLENRLEVLQGSTVWEIGGGINQQQVNDKVDEFTFIDSADFVIDQKAIQNYLKINGHQFFGYIQGHVLNENSATQLSGGIRANYFTFTNELLVSPRAMIRHKLSTRIPRDLSFATGLYSQHPLYREFRDINGNLQTNVKAQKSIHFIGGINSYHQWWGRPFVTSAQVYYKYLYSLNPYDIDNVRLRYFATNQALGYAYGFDYRVNGEFIEGRQSWFSLSWLTTKENIAGDDVGFIRRPSDQRLTIAAFFEDYMAHDPTLRVNLTLNLGTGFPLGPPGSIKLRNAFQGDEYYRVDLGISKYLVTGTGLWPDITVRIEVLNALAAENTLSYSWIEDVNGTSFAIPNSLTARFFNLKCILQI